MKGHHFPSFAIPLLGLLRNTEASWKVDDVASPTYSLSETRGMTHFHASLRRVEVGCPILNSLGRFLLLSCLGYYGVDL